MMPTEKNPRRRWPWLAALVVLGASFGVFMALPPSALGTTANSVQSSARSFFSGLVTLAGGAVFKNSATDCAAPGLAVRSDTDTGFDATAANTLAMCAGGVRTLGATATTVLIGPVADQITITPTANDAVLGDFAQTTAYVSSSAGFSVGTTGVLTESAITTGGAFLASDVDLNWTSSTTNSLGTVDTNLSRVAAGVVGAGTGAAGAIDGALQATTLKIGATADVLNITATPNDSVLGDVITIDNYQITRNGICASAGAGNACEAATTIFGHFMASDIDINWSSSATNSMGVAADSNLSRISAGVVGVGTGAVGSVAGIIEASGLYSTASGDRQISVNGGSGGIFMGNTKGLYWTNSATNALSGVFQTVISQVSSGVLGVGTTAAGVAGMISARGYVIVQADLTASCTVGWVGYDTGGITDELCYCQATDTWMCTTVVAGPID